MQVEPPILVVGLWLAGVLHVVTPIMALFERTWARRLAWLSVTCSIPLLGPLYYLLFRREWEASDEQPDRNDPS